MSAAFCRALSIGQPTSRVPKFIPAESADKIRVADLILDQGRHLTQQIVPGQMTAAIVHGFEPVQVHVKKHVNRFFGVRRIHGFLQAPLEFAAVYQAGQRIVCRLITHLAGQSANFADVMEYDDGT